MQGLSPRKEQKSETGKKTKVLCALKLGGCYDTDYIDRLGKCIGETNKDFELKCLSDAAHPLASPLENNWPGWWSKINLLNPDVVGGGALICDLDTIFVDTLPIPARLTMLRDFYQPNLAQSGLVWVTAEAAREAWQAWIKDPEGIMSRYRGDGEFLRDLWSGYHFWQDDYPGKVVSYKVHCQDGLPDGAAVVCYHGKPRPRDTGWAIE